MSENLRSRKGSGLIVESGTGVMECNTFPFSLLMERGLFYLVIGTGLGKPTGSHGFRPWVLVQVQNFLPTENPYPRAVPFRTNNIKGNFMKLGLT